MSRYAMSKFATEADRDRAMNQDKSKELEQAVAHTMMYCQHYSMRGMPTACIAGVEYASVGKFSAVIAGKERMAEARPCINGHLMPDPLQRCPKWLRSTREQGIAAHEAFQKATRGMSLVMPVVRAWRTWSKANRVGKSEVIECPVCKGNLHLSQSGHNGHVWGKCETADCVEWME